jgi:hypothetical protein
MLVPFSIDPEAMPMDGTARGPRRHSHERLIEQWLTRGLLVFAGPRRDESAIVAKIATLPQDLRTMWKAALRIGRTSPGPAGWPGLEYLESMEDLRPLQGVVRLACLETVLHETIIPWTAEWLVSYELYLTTGKWLGSSAVHTAKTTGR